MLKKQIDLAMKRIATRRPGRSRLVFDRETGVVVAVDQDGNKTPAIKMPSEPTWI